MTDEITNKVLLSHMQGMKSELIERIAKLEVKVDNLEKKVDDGFEDARRHREALQKDLDASIIMLGKHKAKLAKISV